MTIKIEVETWDGNDGAATDSRLSKQFSSAQEVNWHLSTLRTAIHWGLEVASLQYPSQVLTSSF